MKLIQCPYFTMDFPIISRTLQKMFVICEISMWQTNYLPSWIDFLFDTLIYWNFLFFRFGTNMIILAQGMFIFLKIIIKFSHTWHWIIKNILLRCIRNLYYDSNFSIVKPCFIHNYSNDRIEKCFITNLYSIRTNFKDVQKYKCNWIEFWNLLSLRKNKHIWK